MTEGELCVYDGRRGELCVYHGGVSYVSITEG